MMLKMDLVEKVPLGPQMCRDKLAILERAKLLKGGEILAVHGLEGNSSHIGGRISNFRRWGFHTAVRTVDGVVSVYIWRKDSPAG